MKKSNYHVHTDECPDDCDKEEWPHDDIFDWVGHHSYEKIDWNKEEAISKANALALAEAKAIVETQFADISCMDAKLQKP